MNVPRISSFSAARQAAALVTIGLIAGALQHATAAPAPLTTIEYRVQGVSLNVSPPVLSVPKNIGGSVSVQLTNGVSAPDGSFIEATLRGPSFPARRLVGQPNAPLLLPPISLVGDYSLDGIKLADANGVTILEGTPPSVPVHVFDEVLISRVTSRPLTLTEIQEKGIVIDEQNFHAVEFEVGFVVDGKTIPVKFPVVAPTFAQSTEVITAAELEERLKQAEEINREISLGATLPPELEGKRLNIDIQGINFQFTEEDDTDLALHIPPIPALMVIPGNIGFLNQFFSVMIFTENGAPVGSGLSVRNLNANLVLPLGQDRVAGTFDQPGDDPLRFARVGANAQIFSTLPVVQPGADGKLGTTDDNPRLNPGDTGQAEFLVEGLQEGLHVMDLKLTALLDGLAAGPVAIEGRAAGSVLVRNPKFSLAFSHPRTVRAREPYEAFVTILNTSQVPANLVNVTLRNASISGGVLLSDETVELGTILPGQTATAKYRILAQRTGAITFSNLTTSDDSLVGRFRLRAGIDDRGVPLSPDTLLLPDFVNDLPQSVRDAANRVLGQALSVATAGQLPSGVLTVPRSTITAKALELAEAGQRVRYGDPLSRVLPDLLLDWQGGRNFNAGFDQILREGDAGREWRDVLFTAVEAADANNGVQRLSARAADFAGRSETWFIAAADSDDIAITAGSGAVALDKSSIAKALVYGGARGPWLASADATKFEWMISDSFSRTSATVELLLVGPNGTAQMLVWQLPNPPPGTCFIYDAASAGTDLAIDNNCDGTIDGVLAGTLTPVNEAPPSVIAVFQDPAVKSGRPSRPCPVPEFGNYGTVLAVLFSKPMMQEQVNVPAAYTLENGNVAGSVQIQPGGRVALLNMRQPVSALKQRTMTVNGVADPRGNVVQNGVRLVQSSVVEGATIRGRVARADGTLAVGIPVTLTYYDEAVVLDGCAPVTVRASQVFTDANGEFAFDFALAGIRYSVSATDTSALSAEALALILDSVSGEAFDRQKLLQLADSPSVQNTLLAQFAVGALPQAIAKAEGLDRALLRDFIEENSPRVGTDVVVALRFRGRGTVTGQVVGADGVIPAANAAVNLFPDPATRELGRGIFADSDGRFAFFGVPLGNFSIEAATGDGLTRTISDILAQPGETKDVKIVLSASAPELTSIAGFVIEADGSGHPGAQVYVGRFIDGKFTNVVSIATADPDGFFTATRVPVGTYDIVAISADGRRKGERRDVAAISGGASNVSVTLQGFGIVTGRVESSTGVPVANAIVAGGEMLVRTAANGGFILSGVPTGLRTIEAGVERDTAAGFEFPRLGSASVNVLPGVQNFVVIRLEAKGRIIGRVLDAAGQPVPKVVVALPDFGGFSYVNADANGNYEFPNLAVAKDYTVSAPAPATGPGDNSDALLKQIASGNQDQILAAIGEAFATFTGVNDPLLNGEGATFNPQTWGFARTRLDFDGQTAVADIRFLREGTVSGAVKNGQGVPIGARVRLTGIGPKLNGDVATIIRGESNSDPALGTFAFPGQLLAGPFGLQAASPFFPIVISFSGATTSVQPDATDIVLQFPATAEINGRLKGRVLNPDGTPVAAGVEVKISFGDDFVIHTIEDGTFDTQIGLPALGEGQRPGVGYTVEARDLVSGFRGQSTVSVFPGVDNNVEVRLLGLGSVAVQVRKADGSVASGASVEIRGGAFPFDQASGTTDQNGTVPFGNLFAGPYAVSASLVTGATTIGGRSGVNVLAGQTANALVSLAPTATIRGIFLASDLVTPIAFAQIAVGNLGFATTGADGRFEIGGIPLGTFRLVSNDPVSGRVASLSVTLSVAGEIREVQLVESALGEVFGTVLNSFGTGVVPNARVMLQPDDSFIATRTVTTGPDGVFRFPGTPAGGFTLRAKDSATGLEGITSATLPATAAQFQVNIQLQPLANLTVTVFEPNGSTRATQATVTLSANNFLQSADTDAQGIARFTNLPLGVYKVRADSRTIGFTRRAVEVSRTLAVLGAEEQLSVTLGGTGTVQGTVFDSNGTTPFGGATVKLTIQSPLFSNVEVTQLADGQGHYSFGNVPVGDFRVSAENQALAASANGTISSDGSTVTQNLTLGASGTVSGRLVRADGTTPMPSIDLLFTFASQSALPGRANVRTAGDGTFSATLIPVGAFTVEAIAASVGGIARRTAQLTTNGQTLNLGDLRLDEEFPFVAQVTPPNTAPAVSINTTVDLLFNEALDPARIEAGGIFLRKLNAGGVSSSLQLLAPAGETALRLVRLTPNSPLESNTTYEIVVVDGDRLDAFGGVIGRGPIDLVGRALAAPFIASFTTRDDTPPVVLSFTPDNAAEQVDTRSVIRLSFSESVQPGAVISLQGPGGAVAGTTNLGVNGLVLVFTPTFELPPNASFTAMVSTVRDLAGNFAVGQPLVHTFSTLDTLGPTIAQLRLKNNASPIGGSTVVLEAALAQAEADARVRFSADFSVIGTTVPNVLELPLTLPSSGTVTIRATAIDRFNNEGPIKELPLIIQSNAPPSIAFEQLQPANGPVLSGSAFNVRVSATDDGSVTELKAAATGAAVRALQTTTGAAINVSTVVPANAVPGSKVTILASAKDNSGASTGEQSFELIVADGTAPQLAITSPPASSLVQPGLFTLTVLSSDNGGPHDLQATLSGAVSATQTKHIDATPNTNASTTFTFDLSGAPATGGTFFATVKATDAVARSSTAQRTFALPDTVPPQLLTIAPADNAPRQTLWLPGWTLTFDEALQPSTLTAQNLTVRDPADAQVPFTVQTPTPASFSVVPQVPLRPGTVYRLIVGPGVTDIPGNPWKDIGGSNVPGGGRVFSITTAAITNVVPLVNSKIVGGQRITARVDFEQELGATGFRFAFDPASPIDAVVGGGATNASALVRLAANATEARLRISAQRSGFPDFALGDVLLDLRPRAGDEDGDGIPNGYEADNELDPFANDAALDPDNDGLTNAQEFAANTKANNPDTDDDGLNDGAEIAANTNPNNPDSDGDSLLDGADPFPLAPNIGPTANADSIFVNPGDAKTINIAAELLANDTDPEGQALTFLEFTQPAVGGSVARSSGETLVFTAGTGFTGATTFTYTIRDPGNLTSTGTVNVTVGTNHRPIAGPAGIPSIALNFDGVGDQMFVSPYVQGVADTFTIEFWAKPTATRASQPETLGGGGATSGQRYATYPVHGSAFGDQFVHAGVGVSVGTNGVSVGEHGAFYAPIVLNFDTTLTDWTHVAVVYDNRVPRLYLNGTLVRTGLTGPRITHPGTPVSEFLPFGAYQGMLDELRVWSVALSAEQITAQMLARVHPETAGLAAYFPFDENVGDTTRDLSATNATGTLRSNGVPLTNAWVTSDGPLHDFGEQVSTAEDTAAVIALTGSDPDGNPIAFRVASLPLHGKLFRSEGNGTVHTQPAITTVPAAVAGAASPNDLIYEPDSQFNGTDQFVFLASDGQLDSIPASVRINVSSSPDPPIVMNDSFQDTQGIAFTTGNVLANDSDPDGDTISISQFDPLTTGGGSVASNGDGTFNYTPVPTFFGDDTFTYRATDGVNLSVPATVTIQVAQSNTRVWVNANGGVWSNPGNWLNGLVPGPDDIADITLAGTYTVTLDVDPTISQLLMGNASGMQILNVNGRTFTIRNAGTTTGGAVISVPSGTLMSNAPIKLVLLSLSGGNLAGSGSVTVTGTLDWTGGILFAGGELIVANTATGNFTSGTTKGINRVLRNQGTINYTGVSLFFNVGAGSNGRIENESGASFIVDGDGDFATSSGGTNAFNNAGSFIKRNVAATTFNSAVPFNNTGTVTIEAGTLEWQGGGAENGTINAAGGLLTLTTGTYTFGAGSLLNQASLTVSSVTVNITDATAVNFSSLNATNSAVNFGVDYTLSALTLNSTNLSGTGNVTISGVFDWIGGTLFAGGELIVANTATGNFSSGSTKGINRVLRNRGTINYTGVGLFFNVGAGSNGRIENESGASFIVDGDGDFATSSGGTNAFNNAGSFIKRNVAATTFNSAVPFNNTGTVTIEAGTLEWQGGGAENGTINAAGGLLTLTTGTYTFGAGSLLNQASLTVSSVTVNITDATAVNFSSLNATNSAVNFGVDYTLSALTLNSTNLSGTGNVTISGVFDWIGGTLFAGGELIVANTATGNFSSGSTKGINRVLRNRGTINYTGVGLFFNVGAGSNGRIENESGASFIVDGDGDFATSSGGTNAFNNAGSFIKRNAAATTFNSAVPFNNTGTVTIEAGTLEWQGGGAENGTINAAGGLLTLTNGTYSFGTGSLLNQASLTISNITLNITDATAVNFSSLNAISSTVNFGVDYTLSALTLSNTNLAGAGNVTISGVFDWIGGTLFAGGELIVANTATGNFSSGSTKGINRVLRNRGTINYTGVGLFFNVGAGSNGRIENESGASFIVDGDGDFATSSGGTNAFNNAGSFIKRNVATTTFNSAVPFNNTGTVTIEAGTLEWQGGGSENGTINAAGGLLTLTGGTYTFGAGSLLNQASLTVSSVTVNITDATAVNFSSLNAINSTVNFGVDYTLSALTLNNTNLAGTGNVTISGGFDWIGGTLLAGGELIVTNTATGNFSSGSTKGINRVLRNRGTINYTGVNLFFNVGAGSNGRIENESGASFIVDGDGDFATSSGGTNAFNNAGGFIKRNAANTFFNSNVPFNNTGTVTIEAGTMEFQTAFTQNAGTLSLAGGNVATTPSLAVNGGRIEGTGTITGSVNCQATLRVGPSLLSITGGLTLGAASRVELTLGGAVGTTHRPLNVGGSAALAGTIALSLAGDFIESQGATFAALNFASRSGDFSSAEGLSQGGYVFSRSFSPTALQLTTDSAPPLGGLTPIALGIDSDGDGLSDADEAAAGTDPNDALSRLRIEEVTRDASNVKVTFETRPRIRYALESCNDLTAGTWALAAANIEGTGRRFTFFDRDAAKLPQRFYRLRVGTAVSRVSGFIRPGLAGRRTVASSPFVSHGVEAGRVVAVSGSQVRLSRAIRSGGPLAAWVRRGSSEMLLRVTSCNGDTATLSAPDDAVQVGDTLELTPLHSVDDLVGDISTSDSARIFLRRESRWLPLKSTASSWHPLNSTQSEGARKLLPGEGLLLDFPQDRGDRLWFSGELRPGIVYRWIEPGHTAFIGPLGADTNSVTAFADTIYPDRNLLSVASVSDTLRIWQNQHFIAFSFDGQLWRAPGMPNAEISLPLGRAALVERKR